jgi:hypothetical protein
MSKKLIIQIKGESSENESLRIKDFILQLDAIRTALIHIEEEIAKPGSPPMDYRIVDLKHQSPATVVIELSPTLDGQDLSDLVVDHFMERIQLIKSGTVPDNYSVGQLEAFKNIGPRMTRGTIKMPPRKYFSGITFQTDSSTLDVLHSLATEIDKIVGPDEYVEGSISGTLELINIHANANSFRIYPVVGPKRVDCTFKSGQLGNAIAGINRYVNFTGTLRYKQRDKFPYAVSDAIIEVYPLEDELPSIFDLKGIAPNATGGLASEDFVANLRDAQR